MKHTRGPLPSSCLTCRRRRTQCDKTRPACSRCLTSGIVCLGYNHIPAVESPSFYTFSSEYRSTTKPHSHPKTQSLAGPPEILSSAGSRASKSVNNHAHRDSEGSQLVVSGVQVNYRENLPVLDIHAQPPAQSHLGPARPTFSGPPSDGSPPSVNDNPAQSTFSLFNMAMMLVDPATLFRLPPTRRRLPDPALSGEILEFIMSQYVPVLEVVLFKPTSSLLEMARKDMTMSVCSSNLARYRYSTYIGARILQTLTKDGKRADLRYLRSCLSRLEQQLWIKSTNESTIDELIDSLAAGLELVFLNFFTSNSQGGYTLLRNLIPTVLQIALSDLDLWSFQPNRSGISLAHALNIPHPEIYRFALTDALTSLTFGVPLLLQYDTSLPQGPVALFETKVSPAIVAPELAPEFTMMIIKISSWRSKNPDQSAPEDVWKPIETEAWAYQQSVDVPIEAGTLYSVARMAIIEGWRHAILIYLYMGMCGVASNDPRVQSSTKQIMKLLQIVREDWNASSHFFVPCLMASICTPSEKYRAELNDAFLNVEDTKPWLFKAMGCKPVINHLWHGAAANGRPVRWEDYVNSRRAMLHID